MKNKKFLTESDRKVIISEKEKAIIESFAKTFNKIKRIDENEIKEKNNLNLTENQKIDFNNEEEYGDFLMHGTKALEGSTIKLTIFDTYASQDPKEQKFEGTITVSDLKRNYIQNSYNTIIYDGVLSDNGGWDYFTPAKGKKVMISIPAVTSVKGGISAEGLKGLFRVKTLEILNAINELDMGEIGRLNRSVEHGINPYQEQPELSDLGQLTPKQEQMKEYISNYVNSELELNHEMVNYIENGYQGLSDTVKQGLKNDMDYQSWVQMSHDEETFRREKGGIDENEVSDNTIHPPKDSPFKQFIGKIIKDDDDTIYFTIKIFGRNHTLLTPKSNVIGNQIQNWDFVESEQENKSFKGYKSYDNFKLFIYYMISKMGYKIDSDYDDDSLDVTHRDENDQNFRYVFHNQNKKGIVTGYNGVVTYFDGDDNRGILVKDENHLRSLLSN